MVTIIMVFFAVTSRDDTTEQTVNCCTNVARLSTLVLGANTPRVLCYFPSPLVHAGNTLCNC